MLTKLIYKSPLKLVVHLSAWFLLAWLAWNYWSDNLGINPIQAATQVAGKYAINFLVLSLACTPLNTLFGFRQALSVRRILGLYAFMFASLHFLIFIGIDFGFNLEFLKPEFIEKPYIIVGAITLTILFLLAITSFRWWMKRLGHNWKKLHQLIYLAGILVVVHYGWAKKGDFFRLQGDILLPLIYAIIVGFLLVMRLPEVRSGFSSLRNRIIRNSRRKLTIRPDRSPGQ